MRLSKLFYFLLGAGFMVAGTAYAVQISVPSATGYGVVLVGQTSGNYTPTATSSLGLPTFAYPFPNNATSTTITFSNGLLSTASSTFTSSLHFTNTPSALLSTDSTGLVSNIFTTLGDTVYAGASGVPTRLTGNITTAPLYLSMTGDGVNAAAPSWQAIPVAGSKAYYAYGTQATSSPAYFNMNPTATTTADSKAFVLSIGNNAVQNWISPVGDPGVTVIPGGTYIVDLFAARTTGSAAITLSVQVWEVSSTGADIALIGTTNSTAALSASKAQYSVQFTHSSYAMSSASSRVAMRVLANTAGTPTLTLYYGNGDQMDLVTPGATVDVSNFVPYTGATANLNLGAFSASTTQFTASGLAFLNGGATTTTFNANGLISCSGVSNALTWSGGTFGCNSIASAAFSYPFPNQVGGGNATSSLTGFTGGILATASSTIGNGTVTGGLTVSGTATTTNFINTNITSALGLFDANHLEGAYTGTSCTNQFVRSLNASGAATCATVGSADVSLANLSATDSTLTFSGTYNGSTARTIGINLGNANTWTALQQFSLASSTQFSAASQTFYVDSTGHITAKDTVNAWSGVLSPTRSFGLQTGTTTVWTASTSLAYVPSVVMPFGGTLRRVSCQASTTNSFLGVTVRINGTPVSPSYFVSSTTRGIINFTANNTFNRGDIVDALFGTTTTDTHAIYDTCTLDATETP